MRFMVWRLLALVVAMIPVSALAQKREDIPGTQQTFGHWQLTAWKEGTRSGCTMTVGYRSGVEMSFLLEGDQWRVSWWHASWRYVEGQTIGVTFWVDGSPPQSVNADVIAAANSTTMLRAVLPDNPALFDQFRTGAQLGIRVQGGVAYTFKLTATNVALAALRDCAAKYKGTDPSPLKADAGPAREGPPMQALPALTADQRVDAVRLAANLLTRLPGFRLLSEEEQKELDPKVAGVKAAVVWRTEGIFGLLHLFPDAKEADFAKIATGIIGAMIQQCTAETSATVAPDVRSAHVRRIHLACSEGDAAIFFRAILVPSKGGVYYLSAFGDHKDSAAVIRAEEQLRNALFEVAPPK